MIKPPLICQAGSKVPRSRPSIRAVLSYDPHSSFILVGLIGSGLLAVLLAVLLDSMARDLQTTTVFFALVGILLAGTGFGIMAQGSGRTHDSCPAVWRSRAG